MFFFQAEDGIRDKLVTGVQTCALPISYYVRAQKVRTLIKQDFERKFDAGVHAMLTPTTPSAAFGLGEKSSGDPKIGRASCRERGKISVVAESLKKKRTSSRIT